MKKIQASRALLLVALAIRASCIVMLKYGILHAVVLVPLRSTSARYLPALFFFNPQLVDGAKE
jgi:hypothetical protein